MHFHILHLQEIQIVLCNTFFFAAAAAFRVHRAEVLDLVFFIECSHQHAIYAMISMHLIRDWQTPTNNQYSKFECIWCPSLNLSRSVTWAGGFGFGDRNYLAKVFLSWYLSQTGQQ